MSDCLSDEQLEAVVRNDLDDSRLRAFRIHVDNCPICRASLEACKANLEYLNQHKSAFAQGKAASNTQLEETLTETVTSDGTERPCDPTTPRIPGYHVIRQIDRGGQGAVYEAEQLAVHRTVALKLLHGITQPSDSSRLRFQRECELIASLRHPNIVVIYDSDVETERPYFAMEYIDGSPLDRFVDGHRCTVRERIALVAAICDAVNAAHQRGVMHRDLKFSNVLVTEEGKPYVLDFGLAKITQEQPGSMLPRATLSGPYLIGTLEYMSPEQTIGDPDGVDIRTDVYSLGVILYRLLTGQPPYETPREDLRTAIDNIQEAIPPRPSKLSRALGSELDAILYKALEKSPSKRYQSAGELGQDLVAWLEGRPVSVKSTSALYVLRKIARQHVYASTMLAAVIVTLVSSFIISFEYYLSAQEATATEAMSERAVVRANWEGQQGLARVQELARQQALGWFLRSWDEGRIEEARRISNGLSPSSPERAAMEFLLDPSITVEQLSKELSSSATQLIQFVAGERLASGGRIEEALTAFDSCTSESGQTFIGQRATERAESIRSRKPAASEGATQGDTR